MLKSSLKSSSGKRSPVEEMGLGHSDTEKQKGKGEKESDVEERLRERVKALEVEMKRLTELVESWRELINLALTVPKSDGKK